MTQMEHGNKFKKIYLHPRIIHITSNNWTFLGVLCMYSITQPLQDISGTQKRSDNQRSKKRTFAKEVKTWIVKNNTETPTLLYTKYPNLLYDDYTTFIPRYTILSKQLLEVNQSQECVNSYIAVYHEDQHIILKCSVCFIYFILLLQFCREI